MNEKGTIFDIKKYALHDGPGIRTTVFLSGCPLNCLWCHNPESRPEKGRDADAVRARSSKTDHPVSVDELMAELLQDELFYDQSGGGVTFSGGEPMLQIDFLTEVLAECHRLSLHTTVDTCGHVAWSNFERVRSLVDLFLYDLKLIDSEQHRQYTGESNDLILDNLRRLDEWGQPYLLRVPLVPGHTDTDDNLGGIVTFVCKLKNLDTVCLLPYNRLGEDKYRRFGEEPPLGQLAVQTDAEVETRAELFRTAGINVRIGG
jgi:pyruvate formate lyase activating enzyme